MATASAGSVNEVALDGVPQLAARELNVPVVCLTLIDANCRLWTGSHGLSAAIALLISWSFMKRVTASRRPLVITDGRRDPVAAQIPAIRDGTVTAYVGIPLIASNGRAVGTLSVMDRKPRRWSTPQLAFLHRISGRVVRQIEARHPMRDPSLRLPGERDTRQSVAADAPRAASL